MGGVVHGIWRPRFSKVLSIARPFLFRTPTRLLMQEGVKSEAWGHFKIFN
jgi:hypothetical protein